jgi:carboxyl-terminal processing protease
MTSLAAGRRVAAAMLVLLPLLGCQTNAGKNNADDLALMREAMSLIHRRAVNNVADDALVKDALKGMLAGLDPHSAYMDAKEYGDFRSETRGEFGGIGAELARDGSRIKVIAPIDDTPAARGGVRPGDVIERVDGKPVDGLDLSEVVEKIRGPVGTTVHLGLGRGASTQLDVELRRELIRVSPVKARLEPGRIGYVRLSIFNEMTQDRLIEAINRLKREAGGKLAGFVLDLRGNPGGLLNQAVSVAGDFIESGGAIVSTRGRDGRVTREYSPSSRGDLLAGTPMVVLVNGASASASEIVAGALQDFRRATVMGTRTYGKGSVQSVIELSSKGAVKITTDLYYTPSGRSIQAQGVEPDIVVAVPPDQQVAGARLGREADLKNVLKPPGVAETAAAATDVASGAAGESGLVDPLVIGTERDRQLAATFEALRQGRAGRAGGPRG